MHTLVARTCKMLSWFMLHAGATGTGSKSNHETHKGACPAAGGRPAVDCTIRKCSYAAGECKAANV